MHALVKARLRCRIKRQAAKWLEGAVTSVNEDIPLHAVQSISDARMKMIMGDGWAQPTTHASAVQRAEGGASAVPARPPRDPDD